jgi:anaerobic glycerol-3-phosphate dehydrogenase
MPLARTVTESQRLSKNNIAIGTSGPCAKTLDWHHQQPYSRLHVLHCACWLWCQSTAVFEFETSPLFSAAERAALRVAWHGALQPSAVTDDDIAALTQHFSQPEIVEIVAVLSLYGFLNRWNSTLDTELEAPPADFAQSLSALSKDAQR